MKAEEFPLQTHNIQVFHYLAIVENYMFLITDIRCIGNTYNHKTEVKFVLKTKAFIVLN
jgi:hypothetical protein